MGCFLNTQVLFPPALGCGVPGYLCPPLLTQTCGPRLSAFPPKFGGGTFLLRFGRLGDRARRDLRHPDGAADHVSRALLALGSPRHLTRPIGGERTTTLLRRMQCTRVSFAFHPVSPAAPPSPPSPIGCIP